MPVTDGRTVTEVSILEDGPMPATLAADLCSELGASAMTLDSPAACLDAARLAQPDALVLDWHLGGDDDRPESPEKDLAEPGEADRSPRP